MTISSAAVMTNVLPYCELDVEYPEVLPGAMTALQAQNSLRRKMLAVVGGLVLVSVTLAVWTPPPREDSSPSLTALTLMAPYTGSVAMSNEFPLAAFPTDVVA